MTTEFRDVLSALLDREPVDADVLAQVLEDRQARALLVDFVRLRRLVTSDADAEAFEAPPSSITRSRLTRPSWLAAAAAVVLSAVVGGWWVLERSADEPPIPARVVHFEPGVDWTENVSGGRVP